MNIIKKGNAYALQDLMEEIVKKKLVCCIIVQIMGSAPLQLENVNVSLDLKAKNVRKKHQQ